MGKTKSANSKRKKESDSASDTSFGTPKRSCSEPRQEQRRITEYATAKMTDPTPDQKLDRILAEMKSLPKLIEGLSTTIEQLRGEVLDLTEKCRHLEHDLGREKERNKNLEQQVKEAKCQSKLALAKSDDIEQWNRRSSVRILNLPDPFERESYRDCLNKVTHYLAFALNVPHFPEGHIDICHRVGRYLPDGPPRQVLVKFLRRTTKLEVMGGRKRTPKGDPFIVEDLTKHRLELLRKARGFSGARNAWSRGGEIYARLWGDRVIHITDDTDWDRLHDQAMLSPERHPGDRKEHGSLASSQFRKKSTKTHRYRNTPVESTQAQDRQIPVREKDQPSMQQSNAQQEIPVPQVKQQWLKPGQSRPARKAELSPEVATQQMLLREESQGATGGSYLSPETQSEGYHTERASVSELRSETTATVRASALGTSSTLRQAGTGDADTRRRAKVGEDVADSVAEAGDSEPME